MDFFEPVHKNNKSLFQAYPFKDSNFKEQDQIKELPFAED